MRRPSPAVAAVVTAALASLASVGCGRERARPPEADFLVASTDSTYWVTSGAEGVQLRGAPITLARAAGRFYELFVVDDDRSFYHAVLVGQRLYRRDLLTGDSAVVFADSVVPRLASRYAAAHPTEDPLDDGEAPSEDPEIVASTEVELVSVHGPYATFEYHTDVDRAGGESRYATRRGVLDWRTGHAVPLSSLVGAEAARATVAEGRRRFRVALDSVRGSSDPRAADARRLLAGFAFDERSFSLVVVDGRPAVAFLAPGAGSEAGGLTLPLEPVVVSPVPAWWPEVAASLPAAGAEPASDRWRGRNYSLVARYAGDSVALLALADDERREWPIGALRPPVERVLWLDAPAVDARTRRALLRAFDESALYDENARLTARHRRASDGYARTRLVRYRPRHPAR